MLLSPDLQKLYKKLLNGGRQYVFPSPAGGPMSPDSALHRVLKRAGLPKVRFHDLRHSCASTPYGLGYSLKDSQSWLGHSNYKFTADTYVHTEQGAHAAMAERYGKDLEKLLAVCQIR